MTKITPLDKIDIAKQYKEGKSIPCIAKTYKVSSPTIWSTLKYMDVPRRNQQKAQMNISKYTANWDYFSHTENPSVNMWAGFIAADGYISEKYRRLEIEIHPKDSDLLYSLVQDLKSNHKILQNKGGHNSLFVGITSENIIKDLKYWNIESNKSLTYKPPTHLSLNLALDFIKGYFFGDGTLYYIDKNPRIEIIGTLLMVNWMKQVFEDAFILPNNSGSISLLRKNSKQYRVRYSARSHVEKILSCFDKLETYRLERKLGTLITFDGNHALIALP
jgi:hypothetical protein